MSSRRNSLVGEPSLRGSLASDSARVFGESTQAALLLPAIQNLSRLAYLLGRSAAAEHLRAKSDAVATINLKQIP